jgi:hypothetical protein
MAPTLAPHGRVVPVQLEGAHLGVRAATSTVVDNSLLTENIRMPVLVGSAARGQCILLLDPGLQRPFVASVRLRRRAQRRANPG